MSLYHGFSKLLRRAPKEPDFFKKVIIEAEPDLSSIKPYLLILEKRSGTFRWLHFKCPCGCGETRSVNLMRSKRPFWKISLDRKEKVSLMPSVWVSGECEATFGYKGTVLFGQDFSPAKLHPKICYHPLCPKISRHCKNISRPAASCSA